MNHMPLFIVGLSILMAIWLVVSRASHVNAAEPTTIMTVTLRIDGMT